MEKLQNLKGIRDKDVLVWLSKLVVGERSSEAQAIRKAPAEGIIGRENKKTSPFSHTPLSRTSFKGESSDERESVCHKK